jgi:hypothetical protein
MTRRTRQPLALFAQRAAAALQKAVLPEEANRRARDMDALTSREHEKTTRLADLAQALAEMIRHPETMGLTDLLTDRWFPNRTLHIGLRIRGTGRASSNRAAIPDPSGFSN